MKVLSILAISCVAATCHANPQPTLRVTASQLMENPKQFSGKKISTVGYFGVEHHGPYLCTRPACSAPTPEKGATGNWRIHLDFDQSRFSLKELNGVRPGYVAITGTFQYQDMRPRTHEDGTEYVIAGFGFMNSSDKQITEITKFTPVPTPKSQGSKAKSLQR